MTQFFYLILLILSLSNAWGDDHDYKIFHPTFSPPSTPSVSCHSLKEEKLLTDKKDQIIDITYLPKPVVKTLVETYSGSEVRIEKPKLSFFQRLFSSQTSQKFLYTTKMQDQSGIPYLLKDIKFYRTVSELPSRSICANFWTYNPQNQSQITALDLGKKFVDYKNDQATGLFISGETSLGKTALAIAIAKTCFETHKNVLYLDANPVSDAMSQYCFSLKELEKTNFNMVIIDNFIRLSYPKVFRLIIKKIHDRKGKIIIVSTVPYNDFFDQRILPCYINADKKETMDPYIENIKCLFQEVPLTAEGIRNGTNSYQSSWFTD